MKVFDLVQLLVELIKRVARRYRLNLLPSNAIRVIVDVDQSLGLLLYPT